LNEPSSGFDPVEELVDSFLERYRRGERPSLTEYTAEHPELAERIRARGEPTKILRIMANAPDPQPETGARAVRR
jgi:hypothetical protein